MTRPADDSWTPEEIEALNKLPHDERLRLRLAHTGPRRRDDTEHPNDATHNGGPDQ